VGRIFCKQARDLLMMIVWKWLQGREFEGLTLFRSAPPPKKIRKATMPDDVTGNDMLV